MTKVHWFIEDFEQDNAFNDLAEEVKRQGHPCEFVGYKSFVYGDHKKIWDDERCVVVQSSISVARQLQRETKWIPGVFASWGEYRCQVYYAHYGKWLLNKDYQIIPFGDLQRRKEELFYQYKGKFFLRPNDGVKSFTGTLVDLKSLEGRSWDWLAMDMAAEDLVIASSDKAIAREWRCICMGNEVIACSRYRTWGQSDHRAEFPDNVKSYVEQILKESSWRPDPVMVMDICEASGNLYLLEIGAFSVAGLYHCDKSVIVERVSDLAKKIWEDEHDG